MNYARLKDLVSRMERLDEAFTRYQRMADNADGFTSDAGIRHAKAHVSTLHRDWDAAAKEAAAMLA